MNEPNQPTVPPVPDHLSRRALLGLGGGVAAGIALAACGGGKSASDVGAGAGAAPSTAFSGTYSGPALTLSYWNGFTGGDGPFMTKMVGEFMKDNPNITIKANTIQWADYYQRMPAAVTAGKGPDVGVMHLDQLATNAARKVIVPVDDVAKAIGLQESDFTKEVWEAGIYQDARYGIPLDVHSLAMFYNTDDFKKANVDKPPTDESSFMQTLDTMKSAGMDQPFWMPTHWPDHLMFLSLLWQNGGEPYSADGTKATYDSDAGVQALTWMTDIINKGYSPKNLAADAEYVAFKNKKYPIHWNGIWQINDLKDSGIPFALATIPQIGKQPGVWANSHNFYVTRQAMQDDNKAQASKVFIDWMSKKSAEWAGAGMVPARKSVRETDAVKNSMQGPIAAEIDNLRFLPPIPGVGDVQAQTLEIAVTNALVGKQQPAEALQTAASKASQLMEANKKKFGA
jgi:multiple sugar transport system substrate-binding protein